MKIINKNIPVWGDPIDESSIQQIIKCSETAYKVALMADHHKGYSVPIGGVVAYKDAISPSGVGFDIACGNKAVRLDIPAEEVKKHISQIMDSVVENISFGVGRKNKTQVDHELFDHPAWTIRGIKELKDKAQAQLGTVGSGNHYVDIFIDENNEVWVGVHFGSRGLGHGIATHFLKKGGATDGMDVPPLVISVNSPLGQEYLQGMDLAGQYAYAGRDWVCSEVARLLGANILKEVHNHHNFAWQEHHNGEDLWVVRKGATPAFPGQLGFVGGSMGDNAVIIQGIENDLAPLSLYSTIHGAGRVMSRTQARGKMNYKTKEIISRGAISREMMDEWVENFGVELRGADTDESPQAYKRLDEVLEHHKSSIKILHTLKPIGVAMAESKEYDPYKD